MKNINPSDDQNRKNSTPFLVSESSDFLRLNGETRLRSLAKTIPSHGHHQLLSTTQGCITATIHATQEFLSQVVLGISLTNPELAKFLIVSSSGLDVIYWLENTKDNPDGWIPTYPINGFITHGRLHECPHFGMSPLEPAITLGVNRSDEPEFDDFTVVFSVADSEDMRVLSMLMNESVELWDKFERIFNVTPFTSIPLPEEAESQLSIQESCREYVNEFINHVVSKDDNEECFETIDICFAVKRNTPLHVPIIAAISLLRAFTLYQYSIITMDAHNSSADALEEIKLAIRIGLAALHRDGAKE